MKKHQLNIVKKYDKLNDEVNVLRQKLYRIKIVCEGLDKLPMIKKILNIIESE